MAASPVIKKYPRASFQLVLKALKHDRRSSACQRQIRRKQWVKRIARNRDSSEFRELSGMQQRLPLHTRWGAKATHPMTEKGVPVTRALEATRLSEPGRS